MKKVKKVILTSVAIIMAFVCLCPLFSFFNIDNVNAESTLQKYSLLPSTYNSNPTETEQKYNITTARTSAFTPFDIETKKRMSGMSFTMPMIEKNQIIDKYVKLDKVENLSSEKDYALSLWMYFDTTRVHSLKITLNFAYGSLTWSFTQVELYSKLTKSSISSDIGELPFAWNRFELPFAMATKVGDIDDGETLDSPETMSVNYSSIENDITGFSAIKFYDIYLTETEKLNMISVEKQPYRFYSFNFIDNEISSSLCLGDSVKLPTKIHAIDYAWNGETNLAIDTDSDSIIWKVLLKTPNPDKEKEFQNISFGQTITFDMEGTYSIYYQCIDTSLSQNEPVVSDSVSFSVSELNAVYFDKQEYRVDVNKSYIINVYTSSLFNTVSDFTFTTSSDNIVVENLGSGLVKVTTLGAGEYTITASVTGTRTASPTEKEYSKTITFKVEEPEPDYTPILKIVLWCALGLFGVIGVVVIIVAIVKANKYSVK